MFIEKIFYDPQSPISGGDYQYTNKSGYIAQCDHEMDHGVDWKIYRISDGKVEAEDKSFSGDYNEERTGQVYFEDDHQITEDAFISALAVYGLNKDTIYGPHSDITYTYTQLLQYLEGQSVEATAEQEIKRGDAISDEERPEYAAYRKVVEEYESQYGTLQYGRSEINFYADGVSYIDLHDYDADSTDEMTIVTVDQATVNDVYIEFTYDVYDFDGQNAVLQHTGKLKRLDNSTDINLYRDAKGKYYIETSRDLVENNQLIAYMKEIRRLYGDFDVERQERQNLDLLNQYEILDGLENMGGGLLRTDFIKGMDPDDPTLFDRLFSGLPTYGHEIQRAKLRMEYADEAEELEYISEEAMYSLCESVTDILNRGFYTEIKGINITQQDLSAEMKASIFYRHQYFYSSAYNLEAEATNEMYFVNVLTSEEMERVLYSLFDTVSEADRQALRQYALDIAEDGGYSFDNSGDFGGMEDYSLTDVVADGASVTGRVMKMNWDTGEYEEYAQFVIAAKKEPRSPFGCKLASVQFF